MPQIWMREDSGNNGGGNIPLDTEPLLITLNADGDSVRGEWLISGTDVTSVYVIETFTDDVNADLCTQYRQSKSRARYVTVDATPRQLVSGSRERIAFRLFLNPV